MTEKVVLTKEQAKAIEEFQKTVHELGISLDESKGENQMTERLEEIKMKSNNTTEPMLYVPYSDFNWLIEQAERVQELEELTHKQGKVIIKQSDELDIFDQQNKRYREALEEIMRTETVTIALAEGQVAYTFSGHIARQALECNKNG